MRNLTVMFVTAVCFLFLSKKISFDLGGNRTHDLRIRSTVRLPTELQGRTEKVGDDLHFRAGAIIRDGDRKSWDARGLMIWDNFSIFRTNCAILTSYIRADPRTCRGLSRGCCDVV